MHKILLGMIWMALLGLLAVGPAGAVYIDAASPAELAELSEAATDLANGRNDAAERKFRAALRRNPNAWAALLGLADLAHSAGNSDQVAGYLSRAVAAAPGNAAVQTAWGRYQYLQSDYSAAEKAFLMAIDLDPGLAAPHGELGALYVARLDRPVDSIKHYRRAVELAPDVADYRYALSSVLSREGRIEEALAVIDDAIRLRPDDAYPLQLKASLLASHQRSDEALAALEQAALLKTVNPQVHWARGELYLQTGDLAAARDAFRDMLAMKPDAFAAHTRIGLSYQLGGDFDSAETSYRKALSIEPRDVLALNNLAYGSLEQDGREGEALAWAERAVSLAPDNPEYLDTLGLAQLRNDRLSDALVTLKRAVGIAPGYAPARYHLGLVYERRGDPSSARRHYAAAAAGTGIEAELSAARLEEMD